MRRFILILGFLLLAASLARADFCFINMAGSDSGIAPYNGAPVFNPREWNDYYIDCEAVGMKRQSTVVELTTPNSVRVHSEYEMEVFTAPYEAEAGFMFETWRITMGGISSGELEEKHLGFSVCVNGSVVPDDEVRYLFVGVDPENDISLFLTAVFPLRFEQAGLNKVVIDYSYEMPRTFEEIAQSKKQIGWRYDLAPAAHWAGNVEEIKTRIILNGFKMDWISLVTPSAFTFTADGWEWLLKDPDDKTLEHTRLIAAMGPTFRGGGDITSVLAEGGVAVRDKPDSSGLIIRKLAKGDRCYCYLLRSDERYLEETLFGKGWRRCRLLDNTEGFVRAFDYKNEIRYVDCYGIMFESDYEKWAEENEKR